MIPGSSEPRQLRGHQPGRTAAAEHEEQVHTAHLLDVAAFDGVQPHHLVAAVIGGLGLRQQRGGVVAAELGRAGAAGAGPHVFGGQPHADRLDAALEVRAGRRGDHQVAVLRWPGRTPSPGSVAKMNGRRYSDSSPPAAGTQSPSTAISWRSDSMNNSLGQFRDGQPVGRRTQPGRVGLGPERHDRTVGPAVGLEPFEDLLRVVQHDRRRVQFDRAVRQHRARRASRHPRGSRSTPCGRCESGRNPDRPGSRPRTSSLAGLVLRASVNSRGPSVMTSIL